MSGGLGRPASFALLIPNILLAIPIYEPACRIGMFRQDCVAPEPRRTPGFKAALDGAFEKDAPYVHPVKVVSILPDSEFLAST